MKNILKLCAFIAVLIFASQASASTCYWVGGTGNWDNVNSVSWSSSSGGSVSTCAATGGIPKNSADTAIFDGSSGGGTVTVCGASAATCPTSSGLISITSLTMGAFTGTIDFSINNPNVTLAAAGVFDNSVTNNTRTINLGSGTYTINNGGTWKFITITNCTCTTTSANIILTATTTNVQFFGGAKTYGSLTISANTNSTYVSIEPGNSANNTFTSLTVNSPTNLQLSPNTTQTVTNAFTISGTAASPVLITSGSASNVAATLAVGAASTCTYCMFRGITGATNTITATSSFSLGTNGGTLSISNPSGGGGGGHIIGG